KAEPFSPLPAAATHSQEPLHAPPEDSETATVLVSAPPHPDSITTRSRSITSQSGSITTDSGSALLRKPGPSALPLPESPATLLAQPSQTRPPPRGTKTRRSTRFRTRRMAAACP